MAKLNMIFLMLLQGEGGGLLAGLLPIVLMFAIFYFLLIRPQQKRQRQVQADREKMLSALKPGDKVVSSGGIFGTIVSVRDDKVQMRIAQSVSVEMERSAVARLQNPETNEAAATK
jgi:preprotein translocase subunit YajC